ncbi:hypothetical protein K438DRAFT_566735 [Mycena galopus ATCC 62051]|nr:hypothetical protein K438DRAFT_566735 [Mycena galopus ATCC 62051]
MRNVQPVSSFSYYNNPFSSGCDITNLTANLAISAFETSTAITDISTDPTVAVNCHIPAAFTLTWSGTRGITSFPFQTGINPARDNFDQLASDTAAVFLYWPANETGGPGPDQLSTLRVTVQPCYDCGTLDVGIVDEPAPSLIPIQPPWSRRPAQFKAIQMYIEHTGDPVPISWQGSNKTDIFVDLPSNIQPYFGGDSPRTAFNMWFQNIFQSLYHLVRLELGVILEN